MLKADNLPPSCAVVMKSGNLNFLEPSGPFQACNGTALPLPLLGGGRNIPKFLCPPTRIRCHNLDITVKACHSIISDKMFSKVH